MSTSIDNRSGFGKPGSNTGGVMREASGTASVSSVWPEPAGGPGSGVPGTYRGATTSGNRNVAAPSSNGSGPTSRSSTVTRSRARMLPTRMVNTSGRSSSAIDARCPAAMARS
jgi:hypothetical protein